MNQFNMDYKEIIKTLEDNDISVEDFAHFDFKIPKDFIFSDNSKLSSYEMVNEYLEFIGLGEIQVVDKYGGEGKGDTWYSVKYFKKHNIYIKTIGFYTSYNGVDLYDGYGDEVKPNKRTVIIYE